MAEETTVKTLAELTGEELATMSAKDVIDALGGLGQMMITRDGFYTKEFADAIRAQPQLPLMIPTPDAYKGLEPFRVTMQANGMNVTIEADKLTLVPRTFFEVWQNHVQGEQLLRQHRRNAAARMSYSNINQVPFYHQ